MTEQFLFGSKRPSAAVELFGDTGEMLRQFRQRDQTDIVQHRIDNDLASERAILDAADAVDRASHAADRVDRAVGVELVAF